MRYEWRLVKENTYEGFDSLTDQSIGNATAVDLVFGSNSQLRALSEVYASDGNRQKFISDFINAWNKVMNADRFDVL